MGSLDRGGRSLNGIWYPDLTMERTYLYSVMVCQFWAKWASLPPTGMFGRGRGSGGQVSLFFARGGPSAS